MNNDDFEEQPANIRPIAKIYIFRLLSIPAIYKISVLPLLLLTHLSKHYFSVLSKCWSENQSGSGRTEFFLLSATSHLSLASC